jgi:hypothetical protein
VCGKYILPLPDELVNIFRVAQIPDRELHADNRCKQAVLGCGGDWQKLPDGPLRKAYEEAAKLSNAEPSHADRDIRCDNCFKLFDVMEAEVGARRLPNTLTELEDRNNPWIKCPHCGCTM